MAFNVLIEMERRFEVSCGYEKVFALLADVPRSVSHFPKLEQLVDLGDDTFRWEMEKIGLAAYSIQTIYACSYTDNANEGWVKWKPVAGEGNALVEGSWNLVAENDGEAVQVGFHTKGDLTVNLPWLAKIAVAPLVAVEFNGLVDQYIENLKKTLDRP